MTSNPTSYTFVQSEIISMAPHYFKFKLMDHWFGSHWSHDQRLKLLYFFGNPNSYIIICNDFLGFVNGTFPSPPQFICYANDTWLIKRSRLLMVHFLPFMAKEMTIYHQISLFFLFFICLKCSIICSQLINS